MFASDRDLIVLEPNLLRDVAWVGQRLVKGDATISGTTLTLSNQDIEFDSAGIEAGHIVLVDGVAYEVLVRLSKLTLTVSRMRTDSGDAAIPPTPVGPVPMAIYTFAPQLALVHNQVLRLIGIEPEDPASLGRPTESSITNPGTLRRLVGLGALHLIYAAASALSPAQSPQAARAAMYRSRFGAERERVAVRLDLNGDGYPDATRRPNVLQFIRG